MRIRLMLVWSLSALIFSLTACSLNAASTRRAAPIETPTLSGPPGTLAGDQLMYPGDSMPTLAIYAISITDSQRYFHVVTTAGQFFYEISSVEPGTYYVIAYLAQPQSAAFKALAGGYTKFLACEGSPDCNDHTLIPVTIHPGETVSHIDPNDYYGGTFPPRPGSS